MVAVVERRTDQGSVSVRRESDALTEIAFPYLFAGQQLFALLDEWINPNRVPRAVRVD